MGARVLPSLAVSSSQLVNSRELAANVDMPGAQLQLFSYAEILAELLPQSADLQYHLGVHKVCQFKRQLTAPPLLSDCD